MKVFKFISGLLGSIYIEIDKTAQKGYQNIFPTSIKISEVSKESEEF